MDKDLLNQIAFTIAQREILKNKPPQNAEGLQKWIADGAKEYDISPEQFAEFVDVALATALEKTREHLKTSLPQKKKSGIGFSMHTAS